jgi:hypothetical protein
MPVDVQPRARLDLKLTPPILDRHRPAHPEHPTRSTLLDAVEPRIASHQGIALPSKIGSSSASISARTLSTFTVCWNIVRCSIVRTGAPSCRSAAESVCGTRQGPEGGRVDGPPSLHAAAEDDAVPGRCRANPNGGLAGRVQAVA